MKALKHVRTGVMVLSALGILALGVASPLAAQDETAAANSEADEAGEDDGFGAFGDEEETLAPELKWSGDVRMGGQNYFDKDALADDTRQLRARARLNMDLSVGPLDATLKLRARETLATDDWLGMVDEAWLRLNLGSPYLEAGLMKQTWGKADSLRVLDIVNPQDMSDLTSRDFADNKIAQLMVHGVVPVGESLTVEALWLPFFDDTVTAFDGPWAPKQIRDMKKQVRDLMIGAGTKYYALSGVPTAQAQALATYDADARLGSVLSSPDTHTIEFQQAGARITGTLSSVDLGVQYFWGYLGTPVATMTDPAVAQAILAGGNTTLLRQLANLTVPLSYNRYHHIGLDAAAVILGLNTRAEVAANLTDDFDGTKTAVYNPSLAWSLGFDRELVEGITLMVEGRGAIILQHSQITAATDIQNGTTASSTMVLARLNQKLFKDTFEWEVAGLWGIEDQDFAIAPALTFDIADAQLRLGGRWFGGKEDGNLGQYAKSSFVEAMLSYKF